MNTKNKYDVVVIIGNGFDLNLNLKTSYTDFIKSSEFKKLIDNQNRLSNYLKSKHELQNWIDIENELKIYSKNFAYNDKNFKKEFKDLSQALYKYLSKIEINNIDEKSEAFRMIRTAIDKGEVLIIDFNYTNTISKISKKFNFNINSDNSNVTHIKIHGSLEDNNIIFGVEDDADILPQHIFLKKSVNKNFNAIDFSEAIKNSDYFVIFGHSLGNTDHMYFKEYFHEFNYKESYKKHIVIYYYDEGSYDGIFAQLDKLTRNKISKLKQFNDVIETIDTKKQQ